MKSPIRILAAALAFAGGGCVLADSHSAKPPLADFDGMDADRDGKVTLSEHASATRRMFLAMDADSDGKVTAAEMTAARQMVTGRKASRGDMSSAEKIRVVDKDRDGVLTAGEHAQASRAMFEKMDANRDGHLTREEWDAGHAMLAKGDAAPAGNRTRPQ